jgi:hypothetical protein
MRRLENLNDAALWSAEVATLIELEAFPPPAFRVATDELDVLRQECEILRVLHGIDPTAPLPEAAHVSPRFRHLVRDSAYLRKRKTYHT